MGSRREFLRTGACLALSTAAWRVAAPRVLRPSTAGLYDLDAPLPDWALALVEGQLQARETSMRADQRMRATNPEWDLMARTFLVLALANLALRRPDSTPRYLALMDAIVDDTLAAEASGSMYHFLLPYARAQPWRRSPARSLFVDGELLAMMAARELLAPGPRARERLRLRAELVVEQLRAGPVLSGESYPDECWIFCNTTALVGLRMAEAAGVRVDTELVGDWVACAQAQLIHAPTGLLVSSCRYAGETLDGPEGSSIWMSAANLLLLAPMFAREQYARARIELGGQFMGFGYAREWPRRARGPIDVDSGPVIPLLDASPGSSGLAVLGARAFGDRAYLERLLGALELSAFPQRSETPMGPTLRYRASNLVGDAVLAYALCFGPLWAAVEGSLG